ncbi:uncharacterized protein [Rutidosis leptorrhynchoides]|uniref:uncharacterized protein n=1 Tax=Rutidosis leptorrhynchoides TaxID=125765 RepID=UPI003A9A2527
MSKSSLYGIGVKCEEIDRMARIFGCSVRKMPFTYLGMPIGQNMCKKYSWDPIVEKLKKRLSGWKSRTMSFGGRLTLIKAVLSSIPLYYFSLFRAPANIINLLEKSYSVVEHNQSGFGFAKIGICLESVFEKVFSDGRDVFFWEEQWIGESTLLESFPRIFRIENDKQVRVNDRLVFDNGSWVFHWNWSRELSVRLHGELVNLEEKISKHACLRDGDSKWMFKPSGKEEFLTCLIAKEIYDRILSKDSNTIETLRNNLLPQMVGLFTWRVLRGRILVRMELERRDHSRLQSLSIVRVGS